MFEAGAIYWFKLMLAKDDGQRRQVNIKGKVIEENQFMVKIEKENGETDIIPFSRIMDVNKER